MIHKLCRRSTAEQRKEATRHRAVLFACRVLLFVVYPETNGSCDDDCGELLIPPTASTTKMMTIRVTRILQLRQNQHPDAVWSGNGVHVAVSRFVYLYHCPLSSLSYRSSARGVSLVASPFCCVVGTAHYSSLLRCALSCWNEYDCCCCSTARCKTQVLEEKKQVVSLSVPRLSFSIPATLLQDPRFLLNFCISGLV